MIAAETTELWRLHTGCCSVEMPNWFLKKIPISRRRIEVEKRRSEAGMSERGAETIVINPDCSVVVKVIIVHVL